MTTKTAADVAEQVGTVDLGRYTLVVQVKSFKGRRALDVRQHYTDADGELRPTGKGVWIPDESVEAVLDLLAAERGRIEYLLNQ